MLRFSRSTTTVTTTFTFLRPRCFASRGQKWMEHYAFNSGESIGDQHVSLIIYEARRKPLVLVSLAGQLIRQPSSSSETIGVSFVAAVGRKFCRLSSSHALRHPHMSSSLSKLVAGLEDTIESINAGSAIRH